jgi:hypothetical protein
MYPRDFGKRAAVSPLSSEFDKKPRLGLTDEEVKNLNKAQGYNTRAHLKCTNPEDVPITSLAAAFREVAIHVSIVDISWMDPERCEQQINQLPRSEQVDLASVWIEARDTKDWTKYANRCTSFSSLHHGCYSFVQVYFRSDLPCPAGIKNWLRTCHHVCQICRARKVRFSVVCQTQPSLIIMLPHSNYGVMGHCICWQRA